MFDPATSVFTTLSREAGLPTDKLESVQVQGEQLRLSFGTEYLRFASGGYRQFPPITFDPKTNHFAPNGEPKLLTQTEAEAEFNKAPPARLPFLGGVLSKRQQRDGQTYLCGTRGLVILDGGVTEPQIAPLGAKLWLNTVARQLAESELRKPAIQTPADLAAALKDENPFYRANAIGSLLGFKRPLDDRFLPLVISQLSSATMRVRSTSLYVMTLFTGDKHN